MTRVTLTFDNGPVSGTTDRVLDLLGERGLATTFFVVGERLREPGGLELAARARAEGHRVGNHSLTHGVPLGHLADPAAAVREVAATDELLGPLAGPAPLFRPFGLGGRLGPHLLHPAAVEYLLARPASVVLWNAVPRDWDDPGGWVDRLAGQVHRAEGDWALVVLHDVPGACLSRLAEALDRLADDGAEFRQDYPAACVPVRDGAVVAPIDAYVGGAPPGPGPDRAASGPRFPS